MKKVEILYYDAPRKRFVAEMNDHSVMEFEAHPVRLEKKPVTKVNRPAPDPVSASHPGDPFYFSQSSAPSDILLSTKNLPKKDKPLDAVGLDSDPYAPISFPPKPAGDPDTSSD
jgi:hypothetical protein